MRDLRNLKPEMAAMKKLPKSSGRPGGPSLPQSGEGLIPAGEQLLDPKEVGKRLKLSPRTVSEMANDGRLPAYRVGIYLRFKWAEIENSLRRASELEAEGASRTGHDFQPPRRQGHQV